MGSHLGSVVVHSAHVVIVCIAGRHAVDAAYKSEYEQRYENAACEPKDDRRNALLR